MATFSYIARDATGQRVAGTLAGATEQAVLIELAGKALSPVRVEEVHERRTLTRGVAPRRLANAYRQMADLLRVGMPLLRAIELLARNKSSPRLAAVMGDVASQVVEGARLADALGRHPDVFPAIQVAMIKAGERGGFLEPVLARLGTFIEQQADMKSKVVGALIYPFVLLTIGAGVIVWALVFQVPKFAVLFQRIEMPLPTRLLMGLSKLVVEHWGILLLGAAGVIVILVVALRNPALQLAFARFQLRIPKWGPMVSSLAVARFTRILGTLLTNAVPILPSLQISCDAVGHPVLAEAIDEASDAVRAGESLAQPLAKSGMFPEDVSEMIGVGEEANNLGDVLVTIAETIEKRVDRMLNLFVRLMEPLLLLALAGVVLFIFIALVVPMLRLSSSI